MRTILQIIQSMCPTYSTLVPAKVSCDLRTWKASSRTQQILEPVVVTVPVNNVRTYGVVVFPNRRLFLHSSALLV